mgnify:FL=1
MSRAAKGRATTSQLRIIGGQWRGRKLAFTPAEGLRPTTDRVRETLFNWLAPEIHGARCLDLFAGSGALGLEALSRGAAHCDFVDTSASALRDICAHLRALQAQDSARCHQAEAVQFLQRSPGPWDIVFIDPPFARELVAPVCQWLEAAGRLAPNALVYIETGRRESLPDFPPDWELHREKRAGDVSYRLFIVRPCQNV